MPHTTMFDHVENLVRCLDVEEPGNDIDQPIDFANELMNLPEL